MLLPTPGLGLTVLGRLVRPVTEAIRWAEPWDWEHDEDPLLDRGSEPDTAPFDLWS